jgi:anti-sigma B factor antagonist
VLVVMSSFSVREEPDALIVRIDDPAALNDFRSNGFRDALYDTVEQHAIPRVAVDLGPVDFLSSSGVAILVGLKRRVDGRGGKLALFQIQPIVLDVLRVVRLHQYFSIVDDEAAALALIRPMPTV